MACFGMACSYPLHCKPLIAMFARNKGRCICFNSSFAFPCLLSLSLFLSSLLHLTSSFNSSLFLSSSPFLWGHNVMLRVPGSINLFQVLDRFHLECLLWKTLHSCLENCAMKDFQVQSTLNEKQSCDPLMMSVKDMCHIYLSILL